MGKHFFYRHIVFCCLVCFALFSCESYNYPSSADLLKEADVLMESDPLKAFGKLEAITDTASMETEEYMKYIVALVYTKQEAKQNIKNDTLIYSAREYFDLTDDYQQTALANFGAGWVHYANGETENAVHCFLHANECAQKTGNDLVGGRSMNNIGYIYYEQDMMDSAVVYFKKALSHYQKADNTNVRVMRTLTNIGQAYEIQSNFTDASYYYEKGLKLANELGNELYQVAFIHNIGVLHYDRNDYGKAIEYFHTALSKSKQVEDSVKLHLNLARVYHKTHQADSVSYYKNLVKERVSYISDYYTLKAIYSLFSDYYDQTGNHKQAAQYLKLEKEVRAEIEAQNKAKEIQAAHHKYYMQKQRKRFEASQREQNIYMLSLSGIIIVMLALGAFFIYIMHKSLPKDKDLEMLWRGYIDSVNQTNTIDYAEWTTRLLLLERESHFHDPYQDTLSPKDLWLIENTLRRSGLYSARQYIEWAKKYFSRFPEIDKIIGPLTDQQTVLLAMCINGFSDKEKRDAFRVSQIQLRIYHNELQIALLKANYLSHARIVLMMYYEG